MITSAHSPDRPPQAKLLIVDANGELRHTARSTFVDLVCPGDVVVANDAATLPASLNGWHEPTGTAIEVRLAGRRSLAADDVLEFVAVVFGPGDFHTRTEDRPRPPSLETGDRLTLGPLTARIVGWVNHPRLITLRFDQPADLVWAGLARHGRPIQYAHVETPLTMWDIWTAIAGKPAAFEAPSAGFALDWHMVAALHQRGIRFVTLTHAAGISSTGDAELDRQLPFDEPYDIPPVTAVEIEDCRARGGRIIAVGTTVVRALEHSASIHGVVSSGPNVANERIGPRTELRVVDAILTGIHEAGTSHFELLRAFADDGTLKAANLELSLHGYRSHEFGDSMLIEKRRAAVFAAAMKSGCQETCSTPGFGTIHR